MSRLVVLALFLVAGAARAGMYTEEELVVPNPADMTKSIKQVVHTWSDAKHLKQDVPQLGGTVIIDLDKGQVLGVLDGKKQYWKMPLEKYRDQLAVIALAGFGVTPNPDGSLQVPNNLFTETKNVATIEGRKATEWTVTSSSLPGLTTSVWVSTEVPFDAKVAVAQLRLQLGDPKKPGFEDFFTQWGGLGGYPIQYVTTVRMQQSQIVTSRTLLTALEKDPAPGTFTVPKGYALVEDPLTQLQRQAAAQQKPVGIGAPLGH